jgi:two-component system phosphate regulon sensor histidine kinase PhoR
LKQPTKRSKLFFYSFIFLVAVVLAQLTWWIYFQIRNVDDVYNDVLKLSEHTRSTAILKIEEMLRYSDTSDRMIIGEIILSDNKIERVMGDSSGFNAVRSKLMDAPVSKKYYTNWRIEYERDGSVSVKKINEFEVYLWFGRQFPNLKMMEIANEPRDYFIMLSAVVVKEEFETAAFVTVKKRIRMFIAEGLFFVTLVILAVFLLYSTLRKEWLYTHQTHNFMLSVTHELKSPLASIRLYIETLLKHDPEKEKREAFLIRALSDTDRLQDLVENILNASRLESDELNLTFTEVNVSELLESMIKNSRYLHHSRIDCDASLSADAWVLGDERHLHSLFNNLVDNALKYSKDQVKIAMSDDSENWYFTFEDNGIGIPQEFQALIFERFFRVDDELTRKSTGVGLGLFIVKKIAQLHHGDVSLISEVGKGSVFTVKLPKIKDTIDDTANIAG